MTTTCQICGRAIKSKLGQIAHHGYRQPWGNGERTASCPGARYLPYEISRDAIPPVRANYEMQREAAQRAADAMMSTPPASFTIRRRYAGYETGEPIVLSRPVGFDAARNMKIGGYRMMTYEIEHSHRTRTLRSNVKMLAETIAFLDERYANWRAAA